MKKRFTQKRLLRNQNSKKTRKNNRPYKKTKRGGADKMDADELYDQAMIDHQKDLISNPQECILNSKINSGIIFPNVKTGGKIKKARKINKKEEIKIVGGGTKIDWIHNFTDKLVEQFKLALKTTNVKSLSIFNPSITWVRDDGNKSIYCCTSRCIIYVNSSGLPLTDDEVDSYYDYMNTDLRILEFTKENPDKSDSYVSYPGNIFNKWITPGGFWRAPPGGSYKDFTMLTIIERDLDKINCVFSQIINSCEKNSSPIDARVFNIFTQQTVRAESGDNVYIDSVYVTGSSSFVNGISNPSKANVHGDGKRKEPINPESRNPKYNGKLVASNDGWKQSLSRVQVLSFNGRYALSFPGNQSDSRHPFNTLENCKQESLANCISWNNNTEKNYAMYYYNYTDDRRVFSRNKCMILNFELTGKPSDVNPVGGIVFYVKEFDSAEGLPTTPNTIEDLNATFEGKQFETEFDKTWRTIQPNNSDIFNKIVEKYEICDLKVSCTTPFISLGDSLVAVGHIKLDIFKYLNHKLKEAVDIFGTDYNKIKSYYQGNTVDGRKVKRDHLFNYGLSLIEWAKTNIINNSEHGQNGDKKFMAVVKRPDSWPESQKCYTYLKQENYYVRDFLLNQNFIFRTSYSDAYITMRNLHPLVVYFMFFYKINKNTLELESFSHPFMILKDANCSFLNFPMGITTNHRRKESGERASEKHIWLSYGEGDCQCNIAAFKESQFNNLVNQNNNSTDLDNIEFWSYKGGDI